MYMYKRNKNYNLDQVLLRGTSKENTLNSLQGLLQFAMDQTKAEDAPNPSAYTEMDEEVS